MAEELHQALQNILRAETKKIILSNAQKEAEYRKIEIAQKSPIIRSANIQRSRFFTKIARWRRCRLFVRRLWRGIFDRRIFGMMHLSIRCASARRARAV